VKPASPQELLGSLGHETQRLLERSSELRGLQVERQVALGHSLLDHVEAWGEGRVNICEFLARAIEVCRATLEDPLIAQDRRRELRVALARLSARLQEVRLRL
jgi:hypothetical protein